MLIGLVGTVTALHRPLLLPPLARPLPTRLPQQCPVRVSQRDVSPMAITGKAFAPQTYDAILIDVKAL